MKNADAGYRVPGAGYLHSKISSVVPVTQNIPSPIPAFQSNPSKAAS
jgi:hypothetical protein